MIFDIEMPGRGSPGRPRNPLWEKIADIPVGKPFALVKGIDYEEDSPVVRGRMYRAMHKRGIAVATAIRTDETTGQERIHCVIKEKENNK